MSDQRSPAPTDGSPNSLSFFTGVERVDATLRMVVSRLEAAFAGRVHGYYLTGSYACGEAVATSDLDLSVVFQGALTTETREAALRLADACVAEAPVELDLEVRDAQRLLTEGAHPSFILGSQRVYSADGDDLRPHRPLAEWTLRTGR